MTEKRYRVDPEHKPMVYPWEIKDLYALPVGSVVDIYISKNEDDRANRMWKTGCRIQGVYEHFLLLMVPYRPKVSWCGNAGEYRVCVAYRDVYSGRIGLRIKGRK